MSNIDSKENTKILYSVDSSQFDYEELVVLFESMASDDALVVDAEYFSATFEKITPEDFSIAGDLIERVGDQIYDECGLEEVIADHMSVTDYNELDTFLNNWFRKNTLFQKTYRYIHGSTIEHRVTKEDVDYFTG